MGRRRKNTPTQRDTTDIANDSELLREFIQKPKPYRPITPQLTKPLTDQIDNRFWTPEIPSPGAVPRSAARLKAPSNGAVSVSGPSRTAVGNRRTRSVPSTIAFAKPTGVAVCVRRKTRREVLFAKNRTGKGARAFRRRRNHWSDVRC